MVFFLAPSTALDLDFVLDSLSASRRQTANKAKIHQEFANGDIVRHPKFGEGMVIEQDDKTMTVMFDEFGQKKLGKGYVKMEKVE